MSLYSRIAPNGRSGFGYGSTAEQVTEGLDLSGRTVLVTGVNSGLGQEAMRVLALRGARVLGTARTEAKAREAAAGISGGPVTPLACELSDPASVRACVAAVRALGTPLDAVIANAGVMALPTRQVAHGWELQLFTNHVGHFLLVTGLLEQLAPTGRVVMLSSGAHNMAPRGGVDFDDLGAERSYQPWTAYGQSKLANLLFAKELSRRFSGTRRTANAVHPGVIRTNLGRHMGGVMDFFFGLASAVAFKDVPQGAATEVFVAVHPSLAAVSGRYFADCNEAPCRSDADDPALAKRLWDETEALVARL